MKLFKRKNHEAVAENTVNNSQSNWDNMSSVSFNRNAGEQVKSAELSSSERQQKKIIAAYALGSDYYGSVIRSDGRDIGDNVLNDGMNKLASGQISRNEKNNFLKRIKSPISDERDFDRVLDSVSTKHEKRILAAFSSAGFNNYDNVSVSDIKTFRNEYPTPMDFEEASAAFLDNIEKGNGPEERREYESAMESFKRKLYGKQNEYWNQMKEIDKVANAFSSVEVQPQRDERMNSTRYENERSSEWTPGDTGLYQTSKGQVSRITPESIWTGELRADGLCQDSYFGDTNQQLFGVFDGVGGENGGRDAALTASNTIKELSSNYNMNRPEDLASALNRASENISYLDSGKSTGVLAKVVNRDGRPALIYATAGDSRLYVVDKKGSARLLTVDEGVGNHITNCLGYKRDCVKQFGEVQLNEGDKVVLCSDGITGDFEPDLMTEEKLGGIVHHSRNAAEAAKNLTIEASKKDDRTAIVFAPDFNKLYN